MADNSKLYITISYNQPSNGAGATTNGTGGAVVGGGESSSKVKKTYWERLQEQEQREQENLASRTKAYALSRTKELLVSSLLTAVNTSVAMMGTLDGEYFKQMKVQEGLKYASMFIKPLMGAYAGLKIAGPIGAAVALGVSTISGTVNFAIEKTNFYISMRKTNLDIDMLRMRSGLNELNDGSRGTEN